MISSESTREELEQRGTDLRQFRLLVYEDFLEALERRERDGLITVGERWNIVARALVRRDEEAETARKIAETDPLTGLSNRRAFDKAYTEIVKSGRKFGLLIVDVDYFKKINDQYGHPAGDSALIQVGLILESGIRTLHTGKARKDVLTRTGTVGRIGGEEFAILLPDINKVEDLYNISERIRKTMSSSPLQVRRGDHKIQLPVTVSIGGGLYRGGEADELFSKVDQALYTAKEKRNTTVINMIESKIKTA